MTTKVYQIPALQPGQEVAIQNCVTRGKVIERVAKNLYKVEWKGNVLTLPRTQLFPKK